VIALLVILENIALLKASVCHRASVLLVGTVLKEPHLLSLIISLKVVSASQVNTAQRVSLPRYLVTQVSTAVHLVFQM
jgi:hypothetical protein